jgi:hypothetical protein
MRMIIIVSDRSIVSILHVLNEPTCVFCLCRLLLTATTQYHDIIVLPLSTSSLCCHRCCCSSLCFVVDIPNREHCQDIKRRIMTATTTQSSQRQNNGWAKVISYGLLAVVLTCGAVSYWVDSPLGLSWTTSVIEETAVVDSHYMVPKALSEAGVYQAEDYNNSIGLPPPYWYSNDSSTWGPCYPPEKKINWEHQANISNKASANTTFTYRHENPPPMIQEYDNLQGSCRPGFLIIGAGKCGTSSLYHYLVGHPRVVPAYEKQIHYFKVSSSF